MAKFSLCGDPHAKPDNLDKIGTLFDIFEDIGLPVIILGDLFDTKEILRARVFNYVHKRLAGSALNFTILVGNHDWFNLDCKEHSLETLKKLPNVTIVDQPTTMAEADTLLMPYYDDVEEFKRILSNLGPIRPKSLFMHQGIIGFDYGNGYIADGNGHGEIGNDVLKGFKRVISGHFHKHDLPFLGTPFSHTFGESDQTKYLGVWDSETDELELVETPFPRHRTVELDCTNDSDVAFLQCLQLEELAHLRVRLRGTEMQINAFDKSQLPRVKFLEEPTDSEQVADAKLNDTDSNEQKFLTWAKEIKGLDEQTVALGLEILGEVR